MNKRGTIVFTAGNVRDRFSADLIGYVGPDGLQYSVQDLADSSNILKGDALISVKSPLSGGVARSQHDKNRESVSIKDFGAVGDGVNDDGVAFNSAYAACVAAGLDLYIPAGNYRCVTQPKLGEDVADATLFDAGGITVYGTGRNSILWTDYGTGADVILINNAKNLTVRDIAVTSVVTDFSGAGSNGISIVNGFDNIKILDVYVYNLPYVEKPAYLDGGKGLSIQNSDSTTSTYGNIEARLHVVGCVYGVGFDISLNTYPGGKGSASITAVVEDCYRGVVWSGAARTVPPALQFTENFGIRLDITAINCQNSGFINRGYGIDLALNIITTKSLANRLLNPLGTQWEHADSEVTGFYGLHMVGCKVYVRGDLGDCTTKVVLGGQLSGETYSSNCWFDLGGTAVTANLVVVNSGGNIASESSFTFSVNTLVAISEAATLLTQSLNNTITLSQVSRFVNPKVSGVIDFTSTNGLAITQKLGVVGSILEAKQLLGATPSLLIQRWVDNADVPQFGVRNDGGLLVVPYTSATAVATVKKVLAVYDSAAALIGYIPIYTSYS
jgi:hypothetical protein